MKNTMKKIGLVMSQTKWCLTIIVLLLLSAKMMAQIPNSGFENWATVGSYQDPTGWATANSSSTTFPGVTKSTDHYPVTVGSYSVKIQNDPSINYYLGLMMTGNLGVPHPVFPITGHPNSLTGYYKFAPLNSDTMYIQVQLYLNGSPVSYGELPSTASASSWTSFSIPLSTYTTADSGHIILAAYYANGQNYMPHGNSVLYIDNLNFDNLITSVSKDQTDEIPGKYELNQNYPNPFNPTTVISYQVASAGNVSLKVFDLLGREVATLVNEVTSAGSYTITFNAANMPSGVYFYRLQAGSFTETKRLVLLK